MPVSQLDSVQLWMLLAAVVLVLSGIVRGRRPAAPENRFGTTRHFRVWSLIIVSVVAFCGDALVSHWRHPVPEILDEFSYLLQADTFAHGRLTNPPPPLPEHFQAPYVLLRPTYQSKYPPAQAVFLAMGVCWAGRPIAGVWLSTAFFAAALCWMLQAWLPPAWALYGSLLAICQLAFFGHWSQSYWGGMVAAGGGALVYGGLRRLVEGAPRKRDAALMALGVAILANSRPYEGLIAVVPALLMLVACGCKRGGVRAQAGSVWAMLLLLLLGAGSLMVFYNQRVTHHPFTLPYQAYEREYNPAPMLFFQALRAIPESSSAAMQASAVDALQEVHWARSHGLDFAASKLFFFWQFSFGVVLGLPLLLMVWLERRSGWALVLQGAVYGSIQLIALRRFLFWPRPNEVLVGGLLLALLVQVGLLWHLFRGRWERLAVLTTGAVLLAVGCESARFRTHYIAPIIPLTIFLVTEAARRCYSAGGGRRFSVVPVLAGVPLLALGMMAALSFLPPTPVRQWAEKRAAMEKSLEAQPGKQLVLVKYGEGHDYYEEWVFNHADLDRARVVWARDLGDSRNNELIDYFPDRRVWWLDADRYDLQPHPPRDPNELPLLGQ